MYWNEIDLQLGSKPLPLENSGFGLTGPFDFSVSHSSVSGSFPLFPDVPDPSGHREEEFSIMDEHYRFCFCCRTVFRDALPH